MVSQPAEEKAYVMSGDKFYKLGRVLPGQRTAASRWRWYMCFRNKAEYYVLSVCALQPSLMKKFDNNMCLTIHVDDLLLLGRDTEIDRFFKFLEGGGWKLEAYAPFKPYEKFQYLKHKMMFNDQGVVIRPNEDHIVEAADLTEVTGRRFRATPTTSEFNKLSKEDDLLSESDSVCHAGSGQLHAVPNEEGMEVRTTSLFLSAWDEGRRDSVDCQRHGRQCAEPF